MAETRLVRTDIGGYIHMRKPMRLRYAWLRLSLFAGIVWRRFYDSRMSARTAWKIARDIHDYREDLRVWNAAKDSRITQTCSWN